MKAWLFLSLVLAHVTTIFANSSTSDPVNQVNHLRRLSSEEVEIHHRQLSWGSGFDFTNLFFHLGLCPEHSCEFCASQKDVGPPLPHCGCPHCDLPHAHNLPQCSCYSGSGSGYNSRNGNYGGNSYSEEGGAGSFEEASGESGEGSDISDTGNARRTFSMVVYIAGAAACAAIAAALVMRKREQDREIDLDNDGLSPSAASAVQQSLSSKFGALMAGVGVGAIPAVVVTRDYAAVKESLSTKFNALLAGVGIGAVPAAAAARDYTDMDDVEQYEPGPAHGAGLYAI